MKILLREVLRHDDPAVARAHRLLTASFHASEVVDRKEWRDSLREREAVLWSDTRWHLIIAEAEGRVIGVATGTYLGNVNTGVIGYLAVSPVSRRLGAGPRLRRRLLTQFRRDARQIRKVPLTAVVGEVRRDNPWLRTLITRKKALALDFRYVQPKLRRGDRVVPLVMYYQTGGRDRRRLSTGLIRKLLYTMWRRVYRIDRPLSHAAFRRMLREFDRKRFVHGIALVAL